MVVGSDETEMAMEKAEQEQGGWIVRNLSNAMGACNGVRWWAQWFGRKLAWDGYSGTVAFPEGMGGDAAERRFENIRAAAERVAASGAFGPAECHAWKRLGLEAAYRGIGGKSPAVEVDGVAPERMVAFAQTLCEAAGEPRAAVYEGGDILQSVEGKGEWEGKTGKVWWVERRAESEKAEAPTIEEVPEKKEEAPAVVKESQRWEKCLRNMGRFVVARVQVEDWGAPEGVFRGAWMTLHKQQGRNGARFALMWEKKGGGIAAEQVLVASGVSVEEVAELVEGMPGAVCREVRVAPEVTGDGRWLEEAFGERPEGEPVGEWSLVEAGCVEPPRPSVFGWHDRFFPIRTRDAGK